MQKPALLYITNGYPLRTVEVFPGDELPVLAGNPWDIHVLPRLSSEQKEVASFPPQCQVHRDLVGGKICKAAMLATPLAWKLLVREYISYRKNTINPVLFTNALRAVGIALHARYVLRQFILRHNLTQRPLVIYTFWFSEATLGACLLRAEFPHLLVVTRVHGYDLLPEQLPHAYLPFRFLRRTLPDRVIAVSEAGLSFLRQEGYREEKIALFPLGVPRSSSLAGISPTGCLHLVSCAHVTPVKRLNLLVRSLRALALAHPELSLRWDHLGGGEGFTALQSNAEYNLAGLPNLRYALHGILPVQQVRNFLAQNVIDVFVSVSSSEGSPVSMQEATGCGIPLLCTDAGGSREIVLPGRGALLPLDFTPEAFAVEAIRLIQWKHLEARKSIAAWSWQTFGAEKNYCTFIQHVLAPCFYASSVTLQGIAV